MPKGSDGLCVGIPVEIKPGEHRVAGLPDHVGQLTAMGCRAVVQRGAGAGGRWTDEAYRSAGAELVDTPAEVYERADLVWKVKEILPEEFSLLRAGQVIFTYLHAPPRPAMVQALRDSLGIAVAYEEMVDAAGRRPLLVPMSIMAGVGAVVLASQFSQSAYGGCGKLLFKTEGSEPLGVVIIGGGVAGQAAAGAASAAGAQVTILDVDKGRLAELRRAFPEANVVRSTAEAIGGLLPVADVVINCTYWMPGDPHIVTREMLGLMRPGSLIMDVSADPHGAIETSETTTHADPIRVVDGILHYAVQNIPALFARSASEALSAVTWPHVERIARDGIEVAVRDSALLRSGVVTWRGAVVGEALGRIQGIETLAADELPARLA